MALSKKDVADNYAKKAYKIYLLFEKNIDALLVKDFPTLLREKKLRVSFVDMQFFSSPSVKCESQYMDAVIDLIKEKYKEWKVTVAGKKSSDKMFTFCYDTEVQSVLTLFRNIEDRFKNMDIEDDEGDDDFDAADINNDCPF